MVARDHVSMESKTIAAATDAGAPIQGMLVSYLEEAPGRVS